MEHSQVPAQPAERFPVSELRASFDEFMNLFAMLMQLFSCFHHPQLRHGPEEREPVGEEQLEPHGSVSTAPGTGVGTSKKRLNYLPLFLSVVGGELMKKCGM